MVGAGVDASWLGRMLNEDERDAQKAAWNRRNRPAPDSLIRSEQPEVAECLFNRCDLVWWAGILLGCVPWPGEAKLLFAARNPGALGHKAVLAHNPFLDFLVRGAWTKRLMLARLTRAPMSSFLVSTTHAGSR